MPTLPISLRLLVASLLLLPAGLLSQTMVVPTTRVVGSATATYQILVASETSWTASCPAPWVSLAHPSWPATGHVEITVQENPTASERTTTVQIGGLAHVLTQKPTSAALSELFGLGAGNTGALGDNVAFRYSPELVGSDVAEVAACGGYSLILKNDATLWLAGDLGIGAGPNGVPVPIATEVRSLAAGENHLLFIKKDNTLWGMGANGNGQLGDGTQNPRTSPVPITSDVQAAAAGSAHSLFVKTDGSLWTMGAGFSGQLGDGTTTVICPVPAKIADGVRSVSAASTSSFFLKTDGTLWATGDNSYGQLGDGTTGRRLAPAQVASGVESVTAGGTHTFFRSAGGSVYGMGSNAFGTLGNGSTGDRYLLPVPVALDARVVAAGPNNSLFLRTDGSLWAMGLNSFGELGNGTTSSSATPLQVASGVRSIAAGGSHSIFVKNDGTLWSMGNNPSGQLADGTASTHNTPTQVGADVASVVAGYGHSLYVQTDGTLWATGWNNSGQLGDGSNQTRSSPTLIASGVRSAAAGVWHSVFVKTDNTLWGMGSGDRGQIGRSSVWMPAPIATDVQMVAAAGSCTLFLKTDGTLWGLGANNSGQLGVGSTADCFVPTFVASNVAFVAAGQSHALFVKANGSLWAMGSNEAGQLGDGSTAAHLRPVQIANGVVSAAAGANHSLFVKADGTLWGMGSGWNGQLGDGIGRAPSIPELIATGVSSVTASGYHSAFLKSDGTLWNMGFVFGGVRSVVPVKIAEGVQCVAAGQEHLLYVRIAGRPVITAQPATSSVAAGAPVTLAAAVTSTAALNYQWYREGLSIPDATAASYTIAAATITDEGVYTLMATNAAGGTRSAPALLTVTTSGSTQGGDDFSASWFGTKWSEPLTTFLDAGNLHIDVVGGTLNLTCAATGSPSDRIWQWSEMMPLDRDWQVSVRVGLAISGEFEGLRWASDSRETGIALGVVPGLFGGDSFGIGFRVGTRVPGTAFREVYSDTDTGQVRESSATSVATMDGQQIVALRYSTTRHELQSLRLAGDQWVVVATIDPSSQWGLAIGDHLKLGLRGFATRMTMTTGQVWADDFSVVVRGAPPALPTITSQPAGVAIQPGDTAPLSVAATGSPEPTYQWYQGDSGDVSHPIEGANKTTFTTQPLYLWARYWVRVSDGANSVDSTTALVVVNGGGMKLDDWTALPGVPAQLRGALDAPAGDGICNLLKFALGVPPMESAREHLPTVSVTTVPGVGPVLALDFAFNPRADGLILSLEVSEDMRNWKVVASDSQNLGMNPDGTVLIRYREATPPAGEPIRFARLKVELVP